MKEVASIDQKLETQTWRMTVVGDRLSCNKLLTKAHNTNIQIDNQYLKNCDLICDLNTKFYVIC